MDRVISDCLTNKVWSIFRYSWVCIMLSCTWALVICGMKSPIGILIWVLSFYKASTTFNCFTIICFFCYLQKWLRIKENLYLCLVFLKSVFGIIRVIISTHILPTIFSQCESHCAPQKQMTSEIFSQSIHISGAIF